MLKSILDKLDIAFGHKGFPSPLFYNFTYALRFELGGDDVGAVPRFARALHRARHVAQTAFLGAKKLTSIALEFGPASYEDSAPRLSLSEFGFHPQFTDRIKTLEQADQSDVGGTFSRFWSSAEFTPTTAALDALLWACLSADLPIEPKQLGTKFYIVDFARRIAVHAYDDRGMDVVAMERAAIAPIYDSFNSWLLDYDRERMDTAFADADSRN